MVRPPEIEPKWDCKDCDLCGNAKRPVWGRGPKGAKIMFVGEGPGPEEDRTGIPFHPEAPAGHLFRSNHFC